MTVRNLQFLFRPESLAVIGASDRPGSAGATVMRNVLDGGFAGPVWPVNPKHRAVAGRFAYPDVATLPGVPDAAVVCAPPHAVPGIIGALGAFGTRAAIVVTGGLSDAKTPDGRSLATAVLDAARPHLLRVLGPDCMGLLAPGVNLNASLAQTRALPGNVAFIAQSAAPARALLEWAATRGTGFSHIVCLGDGADVDFGDVLNYLGSDPDIRAILLHIESITAGRKFMSAARAAARNKPVIAVKADGAAAGARTAGAAAPETDDVYDAALARAGILRVATTMELFDAAEALAHARPLPGNRLAVLKELLMQAPPSIPEQFVPDAAARGVIEGALGAGRGQLTGPEAKRLLVAYGIPVPETSVAREREPPGLFLGIATDEVFGPVIVFGCGTLGEGAGDRAVALPPLNLVLARDLVSRTRAAELFDARRDRPAADPAALHLALVKLSQLAADLPEVVALEVNPLIVDANGVHALDVRVRVARAAAPGTQRLAIRPYPRELEEWIELDGRRVLMRPIRPEDEPQHRELLVRVTADDLRYRFFLPRREFDHTELASFTQIDYDRDMAFIATAPNGDGVPETLGVARAMADPDNTSAEFALLVRSDLKGRGLGRALLVKLVRYCASRGTQELIGDVLAGNTRMLRLATSLGFATQAAPRDPGVVRVTLNLVDYA